MFRHCYILKISNQENKQTNLVWYANITSIMTSFGYLFGGIIGSLKLEYAFYAQFIILWIASIISFTKWEITKEKILFNFHKLITCFKYMPFKKKDSLSKMEKQFLFLILLAITGQIIFEQSFNYYAKSIFAIDSSQLGIMKAISSILILFINYVGIKRFATTLTDNKKSSLFLKRCLLMCIIFSIMIVNRQRYIFEISNYLFIMLNSIQVWLSQNLFFHFIYHHSTSKYNAMKSLGWIIGGFTAGYTYDINVILPFIVVAILYLISLKFSEVK